MALRFFCASYLQWEKATPSFFRIFCPRNFQNVQDRGSQWKWLCSFRATGRCGHMSGFTDVRHRSYRYLGLEVKNIGIHPKAYWPTFMNWPYINACPTGHKCSFWGALEQDRDSDRKEKGSESCKEGWGGWSLVKAPLLSSPQLASLCFWKDLTQQFSFLASARYRQQTKLPRLPGDLFTFWKVWLSPLHPSQHAMHGCLPHQPAGSLNDWVPTASAVHPFATCAVFSLAVGSSLSGVCPLSLGMWRLLALVSCVVCLAFLKSASAVWDEMFWVDDSVRSGVGSRGVFSTNTLFL